MTGIKKLIMCFMLALALLCPFSDGAFAEDASDAVSVRVRIADKSGSLVPAEAGSCESSVADGAPLSVLLGSGLRLEPAEGFAVSALYVSDGELPIEAERKSLLDRAEAEPNSTRVCVPAEVWNGERGLDTQLLSGGRHDGEYVLTAVLEKLDAAESREIVYGSSILSPDKELNGALVDAGRSDNRFVSGKSHSVLPLLEQQSYAMAVESGLGLESWLLEYPNGSSVPVSPGDVIEPYTDCKLTAQWRSVYVVCVQAKDVTVEYGQGLTPEYTVIHSTLDDRHALMTDGVSVGCTRGAESFSAQTVLDAGEYVLTPCGAAVVDAESGKDCGDCCRVFYIPGKAVVTRRPLTIQADSASADYSGRPLTCSSYTAAGLLPSDSIAAVKLTGSQLTVGSSENTPSAAQVSGGGRDVTANYAIEYRPGTLTVDTRVPITVKPAYRKAEYCGKPITADSFEISSGALMDGDVISDISYCGGSEAVCGTAATMIASLTVSHSGVDVTGCYDITLETGVLRVVPCTDKISITAKDGEKVYDGTPLTESGCSFSGLSGSFTLTASASGEALVPGRVCVNRVASYQILDSSMADVTASFSNVELIDGSLTVLRRPIIISAANARKTYDGAELRAETLSSEERGITNGYMVEGGLVEGHSITRIKVTGSGTSIGRYTAGIESGSVVITDSRNNGANVTGYYDITLKNGVLEIISGKDSIPVTVTAASADWIYDGKPHSLNDYSADGLVDGDRITRLVFNSGSAITDVGTVSNTIESVVIKTADGQPVPDSKYAVTCLPGELTVEKYPLVVTAVSESERYTGRELRSDDVSIGSLANDRHRLETSCALFQAGAAATPVEPGQYLKVVESVRVLDGREDVTDNYAITLVEGVLTVEDGASPPRSDGDSGDSAPGRLLWVVGAAAAASLTAAGVLMYLRIKNRKH